MICPAGKYAGDACDARNARVGQSGRCRSRLAIQPPASSDGDVTSMISVLPHLAHSKVCVSEPAPLGARRASSMRFLHFGQSGGSIAAIGGLAMGYRGFLNDVIQIQF